MVKVIAHTARQKTPRQIGQELPGALEAYLLNSRSFTRGLKQMLKNTMQAQIMAVQRSSSGGINGSGANQVQIKRTGSPVTETPWYTVWGTMYVPKAGDQIFAIVDRATLYVVAAAHGGRANEHTVMWTGGSIRQYDALSLLIKQYLDSHDEAHYGQDGVTVVRYHDRNGIGKFKGDSIDNATLDPSGNPSGNYGRQTMVGQKRTFRVAISGNELTFLDHDSVTTQEYTNVSGVPQVTRRNTGATQTLFFPQVLSSTLVAMQDFIQSGASGAARTYKQNASTAPHIVGDDSAGGGHAYIQSASVQTNIRTDGGTNLYQKSKDRTILPSSARLKALTADSSEIAALNPTETAGAVKTQTHSVNNGGATVSTGVFGSVGGADVGFSGAGGNLSLHFKLVSAVVYDSSSSSVTYGVNYASQKNSLLGGPCYTGAGNPPALSTTAFWAANFTNTNAGIQLHLQTTSGTYSGTIGVAYQIVN